MSSARWVEPSASEAAFSPLADADNYERWELRLYVAGQTPKALLAFANLKRFCEVYLKGRYEITVIDLMKNPELAAADQIIAIPTLIRTLPRPLYKLIGDLSNTERVLVGLNLNPRGSAV